MPGVTNSSKAALVTASYQRKRCRLFFLHHPCKYKFSTV